MDQLQNIDLILSVVVKVVFLLFFIVLLVIIYRVNKAINYIKAKSDQITLNIQNVSTHVQQELTVDNFFEKSKVVIQDAIHVYLLDNVRKQAFSVVKRFL